MAKRSFKSKIVALVVVAIVPMVVIYSSLPTTAGPRPLMRLPKDLVPHSYRVFLQPHMYSRIIEVENVTSPNQTYLVTGNSTVLFHCVRETESIYLHSKHLTLVGDAVVRNTEDDSRIKTRKMIPHHDASDFLEIQLEKLLEAGKDYSLFLAFKTEIANNLQGMSIVAYKEDQANLDSDSESEGGNNNTR